MKLKIYKPISNGLLTIGPGNICIISLNVNQKWKIWENATDNTYRVENRNVTVKLTEEELKTYFKEDTK